MARKVVGTRTRGPSRTGSIPKAKKEQSGRKRGQKVVRKLTLARKAFSPSEPKVKRQKAGGMLDHSKALRGIRGDTHQGAMGRRKRRQRGKPKPLLA